RDYAKLFLRGLTIDFTFFKDHERLGPPVRILYRAGTFWTVCRGSARFDLRPTAEQRGCADDHPHNRSSTNDDCVCLACHLRLYGGLPDSLLYLAAHRQPRPPKVLTGDAGQSEGSDRALR